MGCVGFVGGSTRGVIGGLEASAAISKFDYYIEVEYLNQHRDEPGYLYAWSELGFRPVEWLRLGVVAQRTRIYGGDRDLQRGGFFQVTVRTVTAGFFWFNPVASDPVAILSLEPLCASSPIRHVVPKRMLCLSCRLGLQAKLRGAQASIDWRPRSVHRVS